MRDEDKTKDQLTRELVELQQRFAELEAKNERAVGSWRDLWASYEAIVEGFDGLIYICSEKFEVEFMNKRLISHISVIIHSDRNVTRVCIIWMMSAPGVRTNRSSAARQFAGIGSAPKMIVGTILLLRRSSIRTAACLAWQ